MSLAGHPRETVRKPRKKGKFDEAKETVLRFSSDRCMTLGASIAFYSAFSLAPTLLIVLGVAGWFFGAEAARGELFAHMKGILGSDAAAAMQDIVGHARYAEGKGVAAVISVLLLVVGASATFTSLNTALDVVFDAERKSGIEGFALLLRARLMSFGLALRREIRQADPSRQSTRPRDQFAISPLAKPAAYSYRLHAGQDQRRTGTSRAGHSRRVALGYARRPALPDHARHVPHSGRQSVSHRCA